MSKEPVNMVGYFPGGARFGLISIIFARHVEQALREPLSHFLQAGSIGGSVGSIIASSVATEKSMQDLEHMFIEHVGNFIPYDEKHYHKQIKRYGTKIISDTICKWVGRNNNDHETHLYDPNTMKDVLLQCFGSATLGDLKHNLFIPSHTITRDSQRPYDFYRVDPKSLKQDSPLSLDNETLHISVVNAIMASTACSTVFPSHNIEETGLDHVDIAKVDNGITQVTKLGKSLNSDFGMGIVEFGSFLDIMPTPEEYNRLGIVEMTIDQTMSTQFGRHVKMDSREHYRASLGEKNCHVLELSEAHLRRDQFNYSDMLDSRHEETQRTVASVEEYIAKNPDKISMVADFLTENRAAHEAHAIGQQEIGMLAKVINLFDWTSKQQETPREAENMLQRSADMHPQ